MPKVIAVAGKGGTGKTTFSALIIKQLIAKKLVPILAVDADPNTNLKDVLGVKVQETVGSVCEEVRTQDVFPGGMTKNDYLKYRVEEAVAEAADFDLLTMGRPEGPGCYCYANNVLRAVMDILIQNYKYIVMDNEAGFEHLSRKITRNIDILFIVSDPSIRGIRTAGKIKDLVSELSISVKQTYLIVNRTRAGVDMLLPEIKRQNLHFLDSIPDDELIAEYDLEEKALLDLPCNAATIKAGNDIFRKLNL
ncbi:MAG: AAA family ATPase [Candidatus Omnitrophota bacterium]